MGNYRRLEFIDTLHNIWNSLCDSASDRVYNPYSSLTALWFHNVAALDFSVAVNVFWKNLDAKFYDNKDVYGNKDLVPAVRAQQGVTRALKAMDSLPPDYKQFYTRQLISMLQKSLVS